jgi:hypothetical protein
MEKATERHLKEMRRLMLEQPAADEQDGTS